MRFLWEPLRIHKCRIAAHPVERFGQLKWGSGVSRRAGEQRPDLSLPEDFWRLLQHIPPLQ